VTGKVVKVTDNSQNQKVVILEGGKAEVRCTFLAETSEKAGTLKEGEDAQIKGLILQLASYDEDLEEYEATLLRDCSLAN